MAAAQVIRLTVGEMEFSFAFPERIQADPCPVAWQRFAPMELRILAVLLSGPLKREAIASRLGESPDGKLKMALALLGDRGVLLQSADGYVIACTADERPALSEWLANKHVT